MMCIIAGGTNIDNGRDTRNPIAQPLSQAFKNRSLKPTLMIAINKAMNMAMIEAIQKPKKNTWRKVKNTLPASAGSSVGRGSSMFPN